MKKTALLFAILLSTLIGFGQVVNIGDILCSDGSIVSRVAFPSSGRTAEGIVFYIDDTDSHGWAVSLNNQSSSIKWCSTDFYGYDLLDLPNYANARSAMHDLEGYANTGLIRGHGNSSQFPAAWAVDYNNGWYLPSAGQLRYLYSCAPEINVSLQIVGGTTLPYHDNNYWWSSTEVTEYHSYDMNSGGSIGDYVKDNHVNYPPNGIAVRQIRNFDIQNPVHPTYHIGDLITNDDGSRGILFYLKPDQSDGWMVALEDASTSVTWGNGDISDLTNQTCSSPYGMLLEETDGFVNTTIIRNHQGGLNTAANAVDYEHGWYLPTAGQLSKIFGALPFIEDQLRVYGSTFAEAEYWSSSETDDSNAFTLSFKPSANVRAGHFARRDKSSSYRVRAVRNLTFYNPPQPEPTLPDNILDSDCNAPLEGFGWGIREDWSSGDNIYCRINPLVGDLDDDGIPEIVCFDMQGNSQSQTAAKTINVYDGRSKALKAQITVDGMVWAHGNGPFGLVKLPNRKGLIVTACKDTKLYAYDFTAANPSNPVWVSNASYNTGNDDFSVSIGFADFNGDGHPEIYARNKIFDAETGILLATAQGGSNQADSYSHNSHTNHNKLSCPLAFDICGDTRQELILGNEIYDVVITNRNGTSDNHATLTKSITPPNNIINDGHVQVADFNLDGHPDILISNRDTEGSSGTVSFYVWDVFNDLTSSPIQLNTTFTGKSIPLISDFDDDGFIEILIDCCHESNKGLRAYRYHPNSNSFNYLWSLPIDEDSYSNTATLFDFNNDGKNELVFTDNSNFYIYDVSTTTPTLLSQIDCGEITIMHIPLVADVNADGSAEIIVTGKTGGYLQANTMLKVFKSSTEPWRAARKVWNQYLYHVTNVNEDLTIPTFCFNTATMFTGNDGIVRRPYNNFMQQAYYITQYGEPYNPSGMVEIDTVGLGCNSFTFHGVTYNESGLYEQLIESPEGCDTLYNIEVTLGEMSVYDWYQTACGSFTWNGITYTEPGDYTQEFNTPDCDSIVHLHLTFAGEPEAIPAIEGLTEVYVTTDLIWGQYYYSIAPVGFADHYEWELEGADWSMSPDGTQCSLLVTLPGTGTLHVKAWNDCGYTEQEIIIHAGYFDINDNQVVTATLYPNPASDMAVIETEGIMRVKVYDLQGQLVKKWEGNTSDRIELNLSDLASALYTVEVLTHRGRVTLKLGVMR